MMDVDQHVTKYREKLRKAKLVFLGVQILVISLIISQALIYNQILGPLISGIIHLFLTAFVIYLWRKVHKAIDTEHVKSVMES